MFTMLPAGWTVRYEYDRPTRFVPAAACHTISTLNQFRELFALDGPSGIRQVPLEKGGVTTAYVYDETRRLRGVGVAWCRDDEPFVKEIGRDLALSRALFGCETEAAEVVYERYMKLREIKARMRAHALRERAEQHRAERHAQREPLPIGIDAAAPDD